MWLLLISLGCGPKTVPTAAAATEPTAATPERAELDGLTEQLESRAIADDSEIYRHAALLAVALSDGEADPEIWDGAVALLELMAAEPTPVDEPESEPVTDPDGIDADARATLRIADRRISLARESLRAGDYRATLDALELLRDGPGWEDALPYWEEAVDGWVAEERERAGQMYIAARSVPRAERITALEEVRDILDGLLSDFPDSAYAEPLLENLERIERELESAAD